jgi:outer membrane protein assembly factor BamB
MYIKIEHIKDSNGFQILDNKIYTYINSKQTLCEFDAGGNLLWNTINLDIYYRYHVTNELIIYNLKNKGDGTFFLNRNTKKLLRHEENYLNVTNHNCYSENVLYSFARGKINVYDLRKLAYIVSLNDNTFGVVNNIVKDWLITNDSTNIYIYNKKDFSLLWQLNISEASSYEDLGERVSGEIRGVYPNDDSIIILTQLFIFRIDIKTGEFIYQKQLPAGLMTLSIHKNKAYGCYGYHFVEVDLDTSEVLSFHRIEFENYEGKQYSAIMNQPTYHEGLVYHGIRLEGGLHCVGAIYPETGKRVWIYPIGVYNIETIVFHDDKLFVHDAGANLHIFDKSKLKA